MAPTLTEKTRRNRENKPVPRKFLSRRKKCLCFGNRQNCPKEQDPNWAALEVGVGGIRVKPARLNPGPRVQGGGRLEPGLMTERKAAPPTRDPSPGRRDTEA